MATKPQAIFSESAHFNNFFKHIPAYNKMCKRTVKALLERGMIQGSTCFEQALANVGGLKVVNANTHDLRSPTGVKSEAKLSTSQYHRGKLDANVSNVSGKEGKLRIQIFEQYTEKFYYFVVPYAAYKHLKSTLEIQFHDTGEPNYNTKWWKYQVATFEELATK